MTPRDIGDGNLSWEETLKAVLSMIGERVTVNALSDRTGMGVIWINGRLERASDFDVEFRKAYPDFVPSDSAPGELLLLRVVDGPEESENGSGVMLRENEFEGAGWYPPGIDATTILRILQGGTVIQIARWGHDGGE